ncbi:MAG: ABC transporter permease [Desulfobacteraceae bacterium]|jgi:molybdate/tungstate transport system permease protein
MKRTRGIALLRPDPFTGLALTGSTMALLFILLPLVQMILQPSAADMADTLKDGDVMHAIGLSMGTALCAGLIALVLGTPFAYLLARFDFPGKKLVESAVDLPIMIPHPVIGIALLSLAGRNHWAGQLMADMGIRIMGTTTGIVAVMLFVGLPFFINTVKTGFESVSRRVENVSRSLGASPASTFFRVTLPLTWRSLVVGIIMCMARAISEFGAIVIVAYHPMVAPVMIYERFTAYGLKYSQPVAVWLILVSLLLFVLLRLFARPKPNDGEKTR